MEESIKIKQFIALFRKRLLLILSLGFGSAILSGFYAIYVMNPTYESSAHILVNKNGEDIKYDYNVVMTNFQYINTYSDMIYTPVVMEKVIDDLNLKVNYEELVDQVKITSHKESQVLSISVRDSNYSSTVNIANQVATVFKNKVDDTLDLNNVTIFSPAVEKDNPTSINPKPVVFIIVALIVGLIIGLVISFLLEIKNNTIIQPQNVKATNIANAEPEDQGSIRKVKG
ncbi:YveK family protein [Peribacillus asahii]|uniref:YveK family protein n=1 Tax=Peribacillus asahii TaxID=228899 RepID=UPI00207A1A59|nr:Wzz/FepE/Etk N-terminal domain-containing protein [Peribacillus asahii]USK68327.1 capsular biosynthesis protein [Peribacillus asahii]